MSTRTLVEINHDCLPEAIERLTELCKELGHASVFDLTKKHNGVHGVRVLSQRHHSGPYYLGRETSKWFAHDALDERLP